METLRELPAVVLALAAMVALALLLAGATRRRGGRFRGLPGWSGFWIVFGLTLIALSRGPVWLSFPALGVLMFVGVRGYFFLVPPRPVDRWVVNVAYFGIPLVLYLASTGSTPLFMATVPVLVFLVAPWALALGTRERGLLDSMGRVLLGGLFFIYCISHLALLARVDTPLDGVVELFGALVLATELTLRLTVRFRHGESGARVGLALVAALLVAGAVGWFLAPTIGWSEEDGARVGMFVAVAVGAGSLVRDAVMFDLDLSSTSATFGRGTLLDRMIPAVYAAPVFFHYLSYFG